MKFVCQNYKQSQTKNKQDSILQGALINIIHPQMRQTSLLDSFVKKANGSQTTIKKQQPNTTNNLESESSKKQNHQSPNKPEKLYFPKTKTLDSVQKQTFQSEKIPNSQKPQKMQIENFQPNRDLDEDSESPKIRKNRKPAVQSAKINKSQSKVKSIKGRRGKQSDDEDFEAQVNSESEQSISADPSEEDFDNVEEDDDFEKKPKRKIQTKKPAKKLTAKSQTKLGQKQLKFSQFQQQKAIDNKFTNRQSEQIDRSKFSDKTPLWAIPGHIQCRDKYGLSCTESGYDETTLKVPENEWKDLSGPMTQYWRIKSQNFDKIIFFKLGKFYELFYEDALIGNQLLELKWMGDKMHVGFPEKSLERYTKQFVRHGYKVVVVEQMETPQEMKQRIDGAKKQNKKVQKTLAREVTQIITKGTFIPDEDEVYLPNYLMTVYKYESMIAYTLLEIGTNSILMGIVEGFEEFKTVLYQTRPSEIVYDPDNLPKDWVDIMKENLDNMILSKLLNKQNLWHHLNATNQLSQMQEKRLLKKPQILTTIESFDTIPKNLMISTLSGLFDYLHRVFKFQYVLATAKFKFYEKQKALTHMVLDSQALQHLQVFQTAAGEKGSLFEKIDRTKSKFGKRLFRKWMMSPLLSQYQINQRLDAVQDLREIGNDIERVQSAFGKLPDLEKMCNKLYKYSVANTAASSAVYFSDVSATRLQDFDQFMKSMEQSLMIFKILEEHSSEFKSLRLRRMITLNREIEHENCPQKLIYFEDEEFDDKKEVNELNGLLPDIIGHLQSFKQYAVWKEGKITPKEGVIRFYDDLAAEERIVKRKLDQELENIRSAFRCPTINYAHIKQRYEIEMPERKDLKIPREFTFSSKKAGFSRYLVPEVQQIVEQLQKVEKNIKTQMSIFVTFFFEQFKQKQNVWERYINILAEIDCYSSMAVYSKQRKTCRPVFCQEGYEAVEAIHPSLYSIDFVPNNISFKDPIILLTGPNMGGKSTILRTSCLLAIMAQMGCYVTCRSYKAAVIDRIFTRIGASDKLQAGKSTFFIQMEQTKTIVSYATRRSLAIIDELGRGTATYDGMALAHSVLNFLITKINCKCFFATHYHSLTEEFASMPGTCLKMMDYEIISGEEDRIDFLYKLVSGKAEKSFGLNVAQLVGLPKELIRQARVKSDEMHAQIERKKKKIKLYEFLKSLSK